MKLSIITICMNDKHGLEKTMSSVLSQTYPDFEYIVIDGGSSDGSEEYIKSHSARLSYWVSEKDRGIYNAMNKGLAASKGEYCLFLNSGDYLLADDILEKVFQPSPAEDILYGDMMIDYGDGRLVYGPQPDEITFEFLALTTIWHPVSFIRRMSLSEAGGYNEELTIVSDYEFILRAVIIEGPSTRHLPFAISVFNTRGIGSSKEYREIHEAERMLVMKKYFPVKVIESARRFNELKQSRAVIFADWIRERPFFYRAASGAYSVLNSIRKTLKL